MMNKYFISRSKTDPEKAFYISLEINVDKGVSDLYFPYWRPGRYEPGNFVKWSRNFKVIGCTESVNVQKTQPNHWRIESGINQTIHVSYEWCIHELNAGSSFLSEDLFYVNPVNLFCFVKQKQNVPIGLSVDLNDNWHYAGGLPINIDSGKFFLEAQNFDQLADSPIAFAPVISKFQWISEGVVFNCHSIGQLPKPWREGDYSSLIQFTDFQVKMMNGFPVQDYHYIFIFTPYRMRHGVEHCNATMIVMGQGDVSDEVFYDEILSISSHELFHTWNVKYCRPKDLFPYDFTQAQYSATGFVTEGITTYYGELMLWQSGVWSWEKMVTCILDWLNTHLNNPGRFSSSLLDSSIDTWVDGYVKGTPGRKVSIYNEGALLAFLTDVFIIKSTSGEKSLDDVMRVMLLKYNTQTIGYTIEDYWHVVEEISGLVPAQLIDLSSQSQDYASEVLIALEWLEQKCRLSTSENGQLKVVPIALQEKNKLRSSYRCSQL